jgi:hypothetical protein
VGSMLFAVRGLVAKSDESSWNVARHGDVDVAFMVVPVKSEAAVECAGPVDGEFVAGSDGIDEVMGIGFGKVFDAKIVDTEYKGGTFGAMAPEAGSERHWFIARGGKVGDEVVKGEDGSFFEPVHAAADLEVNETVVGDLDVVTGVVPDFGWDYGGGNAKVLEISHWGAEKIIFYVEAEVAGAGVGVGNGAIDVDFCIKHGDGGRAGVAGVVQFVTTGSHSNAVSFGFHGSDAADEVGIGGSTAVWDV